MFELEWNVPRENSETRSSPEQPEHHEPAPVPALVPTTGVRF